MIEKWNILQMVYNVKEISSFLGGNFMKLILKKTHEMIVIVIEN